MKTTYDTALPDAWIDMAKVFIALGDEHRQRILLMFEPGERLNVSQIVAASTLSRPAISHHLKVLRHAGVLQSKKEGKEVFFWINKAFVRETFANVLDYIDNHV